MSKCIGNKLRVRFDVKHNRLFKVGGLELIRPDEWLNREDNGESKYEENVNYLETKPQICEVLIANDNYPYKVGDVLFAHYMAWETSQCGDIITNEAFIIGDYIFFQILPDGSWKLADNIYIGKQVYTEEIVSPSGIIIDLGKKKENLQVKLTHLPDNSEFEVGDTVLSIDKYNYEFTIYPDKYIKLTRDEIAGKIEYA